MTEGQQGSTLRCLCKGGVCLTKMNQTSLAANHPISFPEAAILLVSDRDRDPLPVPVDKATRTLGTRLQITGLL